MREREQKHGSRSLARLLDDRKEPEHPLSPSFYIPSSISEDAIVVPAIAAIQEVIPISATVNGRKRLKTWRERYKAVIYHCYFYIHLQSVEFYSVISHGRECVRCC